MEGEEAPAGYLLALGLHSELTTSQHLGASLFHGPSGHEVPTEKGAFWEDP